MKINGIGLRIVGEDIVWEENNWNGFKKNMVRDVAKIQFNSLINNKELKHAVLKKFYL